MVVENSLLVNRSFWKGTTDMMNPIERHEKLKRITLKANKIIAEKGLNFTEFFETSDLYHYNTYIAHSNDYKKLTIKEYEILVIVVKQEYGRLELL